MNFRYFFPCLRESSDLCHDHTSLHILVKLVGAECWYAIIVCIMCDISQVYHVFQTTVKTAHR